MTKISYAGYRFPPEIIRQAIWLYLRFTLSVQDLLTERGIVVSYETVRRWVNHFGLMIATDLRSRRPKPCTTWRLDPCFFWRLHRSLLSARANALLIYANRSVASGGNGAPRANNGDRIINKHDIYVIIVRSGAYF
jgi:hypothetical protein